MNEKKAHKEKFNQPVRKPTKDEERKMLGKAIEIMIKTGMKNHVYKFHNKIRIQKKGGPIGLALTGEVADCWMLNWDKKFLEKLKSVGIESLMYSRLKDDILIITESLEKGTKFEDDKLVFDASKRMEDANKSDEKITMEVIRDIAGSVDSMISFTYDIPGNYSDGKMPALDLTISINQAQCNRAEYEFYEKPTKNSRVILANSALSSASKRTILTQECLRRLRNTKVELSEEVKMKHLNDFMLKLKNSGYNRKYRAEILDSAFKAFEKMLEDDRKNVKPLFRSRDWNKAEREATKRNKKIHWYRNEESKIQYKSILFVPPTPGGVLAKQMKEREEELNKFSDERIKIVEKGGRNIESLLAKKDPFGKENCTEKLCPLCNNSGKNKMDIACNTNNVGYRWTCTTCKEDKKIAVYEGETSRSARLRGLEHISGKNNKQPDNVLYKHQLKEHKNETATFEMEITGTFKDALSRQADEAVRIYARQGHELMNSKSEFNHPPVSRIIVEKNLKPFFKKRLALGCDNS